MPLVTSTTQLNKLKFGVPPATDRKNGGNSNEPYITTRIPGVDYNDPNQTFEQVSDGRSFTIGSLASNSPDFIIRGGALALTRSATDVSRLTQMFFDFKSPDGLLFVAKQNLLSRSSVKLQAGDKIENLTARERLQNVQELASLALSNGLGENGLGGISANVRNRINPLNQGTYTPLSTLLAAGGNAFGAHPNKQGIDPTGQTALSLITYSDLVKQNQPATLNRLYSLYRNKITNTNDSNPNVLFEYSGGPGSVLGVGKTVVNRISTTQLLGRGNGSNGNYATFSQQLIEEQKISRGDTKIQDFRTIIKKSKGFIPKNTDNTTGILTKTLDYTNINNRIETRVNLGDPGNPDIDRSNYEADGKDIGTDKVNNMYLYRSEVVTTSKEKNDLVKFRIAVIDPDEPLKKTFVHFRSYISGISDSFNSDWSEFKYLGRGEKFYNYQGFDRQLSLNWTVIAQSKRELSTMYQKLNYLASTLAPNYSDAGFMRGNIHQLTIGGYVYEYPGIIQNLTYTTPDDSTWEIALPTERTSATQDPGTPLIVEDRSVKELAHRIEVSMTFKPINPFLPQTVKNIDGAGSIDERFLSLTAGVKSNSLYNQGTKLANHPTPNNPSERNR